MLCVGVKLDICPRSDDELVPGRASDGNIWVPTGIVAVGLDFIIVALIDSSIGLNAIRIPPTQVLFKARNRSFVPLEDTDDKLLAEKSLGGGNIVGSNCSSLVQVEEGTSHEVVQELIRVNVIVDGHRGQLSVEVRIPRRGLSIVKQVDFSLDLESEL